MAHDVLHMVCLGTHPCGSWGIIVSSPRIHPMKIKITISVQVFWVFEALVLPSTDRNTLELVFYFLVKIKGRISALLFAMGVWSPSSCPLPIITHSSLFLISLWRLKKSCPCFSSVSTLPLPSMKNSFTLRSPTKHWVGKRGRWAKR